jgi:hypothetical protein
MTTEERDRKEADLMLQEKRASDEVALRRSDAVKIGKVLADIGAMLQRSPENFMAGNQSAHYDVVDMARVPILNESDLRAALDLDKIVKLANDLRRSMSEVRRAEMAMQACR